MKLTVTLHDLAAIREFVKAGAIKVGLGPERVHEVMVAVDEAVTNIVVHGYKRTPGPLEMEVETKKKSFVIRLRDQAPPFNPMTIPPPDTTSPVEKRPIGGMGVFLIRRAIDEVKHRKLPGGGNELTFIIHL